MPDPADDDVVAVIGATVRPQDAAPSLVQCKSCGRIIDGVCSRCGLPQHQKKPLTAHEENHAALEREHDWAERRRRDRLAL
jgi:hypothetical protein